MEPSSHSSREIMEGPQKLRRLRKAQRTPHRGSEASVRFPVLDIEPLIWMWHNQGWTYTKIIDRITLHINAHTEDPRKREELQKLANKILQDTLSAGQSLP